ncbi:type II toxin-antitoxin system RelE/ParE family toxin [Sphingomonas gilva]|uniref:Type II toxin-antitoxin system RelE/ParE family toxin n=2 Tax=Sphingomonas gilva TaxID=2305907 RepID=A0A396RR34_9SPHN|nr:type II toxin-antitoxin system RelE/ParE family toxin [Sphingomonas gilva]
MDRKSVEWLGSSRSDLLGMPQPVVKQFGFELGLVQNGLIPEGAIHLSHVENGVWELRENHKGDTYRVVHLLRHEDTIFVLHCFKKKSTSGKAVPKADTETIAARLTEAKARIAARRKQKGE